MEVWAILDNQAAAVAGPLRLEAHSLADGRLLRQWGSEVSLAAGERRLVLEADLASFDPLTTLLSLSFQERTTFRLLAEPKDVRLSAPRLVAWVEGARLLVESDLPVVDLFLWDEDGELTLGENFVTLPSSGRVALPMRGSPRKLRARSLQGRHPVRWMGAV
jgi:hypothetical protein